MTPAQCGWVHIYVTVLQYCEIQQPGTPWPNLIKIQTISILKKVAGNCIFYYIA